MLEEKKYPISEIREIFGTQSKQGIDRKLERYGIKFDSEGSGENRVYNIKHISDKFKVYCITELKLPAQCDFDKIRNIFYYFLCDEVFAAMPHVEQEQIIYRDSNVHISRSCISRWINYLCKIDYASINRYECSYFVVVEKNGRKTYKESTREEYNAGWRIYWDNIDKGSRTAYYNMYNYLGGHPYKQFKIELNGIYLNEINQLIDIVNQSFLSQTSDTI